MASWLPRWHPLTLSELGKGRARALLFPSSPAPGTEELFPECLLHEYRKDNNE